MARKYFHFEWNEMPLEIKIFLLFIGVTNKEKYTKMMFYPKYLPSPKFRLKDRIIINLPIYALVFIVIGLLLTIG
ncbi:MAG: hypothetical protein ACYSSI_10350 [Planctomycetota bacterium]|jgi:hypothetical protein